MTKIKLKVQLEQRRAVVVRLGNFCKFKIQEFDRGGTFKVSPGFGNTKLKNGHICMSIFEGHLLHDCSALGACVLPGLAAKSHSKAGSQLEIVFENFLVVLRHLSGRVRIVLNPMM